ncbi:Na+/H+ antiporter NhaC [Salmonella enterica subsp. enterica serovar Hartford]|nr:Na+/H+ antiporter NhaC [Salmonella enterica subsp. enterica serovar Hartford]
MATIKDVASMAGVSTATVSRVINQTAWVEPVTRERVEKAMRDLNYRRNAAAIALAKRSGDMLGLLTGNLADPFFARLARGVEDVSRKQQYRLMVCSGGHDEEMEKAGLDFLVNQGCEAIVVHASRLPDKELLRYAAHFPALVVVNRYIAGMANRCIWLENRSAAREATRYLLANGHRRIACVTSDLPIIDRQERLDGYREALEEYGISPDPRWVISVPFNEEGGERAAHQLINSGLPLTAAVTFNDVMAAGIAWWQGYCWEDIINSVVDKLAKAMPVIMILICVGGLIGTWMFSGTIPYMVYWGLKLISPEYILIAAFFLTSVVSVCTGTSWGSAGTVGVALMGVAAGLDVSLAAAAGAVVSGAYFGDKISPLSDSTNFAAIVADTTLFEHIQHLLWTTLPSFLLAAVVYLIAGHSNMLGEVATPQRVTDIIHSLESLYHFNIVLILPPVIVLWGAIRKKPVIPLMLSACVLALFLGVIMQGLSIKQGLDAFIDGFDIAMFPQGAEGVVADVPRLLNRGGMFSMMGTILLVFCAFSFAGALTLTGALTIIINRLLTIIHSVGQLIAATIGTTILVTGATSDGKLALLVPAELFKDAYRRMGLDTKNLSRTIEDAGTVIEPLLPWTSAGVYMATTLGVSTLDLLPWAIQCYAAIFFALIYGFSGIGIARTASASEKSPQSSVTE